MVECGTREVGRGVGLSQGQWKRVTSPTEDGRMMPSGQRPLMFQQPADGKGIVIDQTAVSSSAMYQERFRSRARRPSVSEG